MDGKTCCWVPFIHQAEVAWHYSMLSWVANNINQQSRRHVNTLTQTQWRWGVGTMYVSMFACAHIGLCLSIHPVPPMLPCHWFGPDSNTASVTGFGTGLHYSLKWLKLHSWARILREKLFLKILLWKTGW